MIILSVKYMGETKKHIYNSIFKNIFIKYIKFFKETGLCVVLVHKRQDFNVNVDEFSYRRKLLEDRETIYMYN